MRLRRELVILVATIGTTGCASMTHQATNGPSSSRSVAWSQVNAPQQTQVSLPSEQPDLFMSSSAQETSRLARYFPGLSRKTMAPAVTQTTTQTAAKPVVAVVKPVVGGPSSTRPTLFGFKKSRPAQTYMTDVRATALKSGPEPTFLPVALQLPSTRQADRAVTPTSIDLPSAPEAGKPTETSPPDGVPSNPDTATAKATPPSPAEPLLAIDPAGIEAANGPAKPASELIDPPAADSAQVDIAPQQESPVKPESDPRERPKLAATASEVPAQVVETAEKPSAAVAAAQPANPETAEATPDPKTMKAVPTGADPTNSLGLPQVTLPASYSQHSPFGAQGSYQAEQPPPVLASPQVAASPQSTTTMSVKSKTWHRLSLRRMLQRMWDHGEVVNSPTTSPH